MEDSPHCMDRLDGPEPVIEMEGGKGGTKKKSVYQLILRKMRPLRVPTVEV